MLDASSTTSLLDVLTTSRRFSATDPKDHVFAFLGHPLLQDVMDADYSLKLDRMHNLLAEKIMQKSQRLDVLGYAENRQKDPDNAVAVPSWVPQWHRERLTFAPDQAARESAVVRSDEIVIKVSEDQLSVAALIVDQVTDHSEVPLEEDILKSFDGSSEHVIQQLYDLFLHAWQPLNMKSNLSFWAIFIGTLCYGNYPSASWIKQDFLAWCKASCGPGFYDLAASDPYFTHVENDGANGIRYGEQMAVSCDTRRFFVTAGGLCGLGP